MFNITIRTYPQGRKEEIKPELVKKGSIKLFFCGAYTTERDNTPTSRVLWLQDALQQRLDILTSEGHEIIDIKYSSCTDKEMAFIMYRPKGS
jgi:hypothetical protein